MAKWALKNRLEQDVPEKCPLADALAFLLTEAMPLAIEDHQRLAVSNFMSYLDQDMGSCTWINEAFCPSGKFIQISDAKVTEAQAKLLAAVMRGQIRCWGYLRPIAKDYLDKGEQPFHRTSIAWFSLKKRLEEEEKKIPDAFMLGIDGDHEIPHNCWSKCCIGWNDNALHEPIYEVDENETLYQFSNVVLDTEAVFQLFGSEDFKSKLLAPTTSEPDSLPVRRGRPPSVDRETWLEELAILYKTGAIRKDDKTEVAVNAMVTSLSNHHRKSISPDTVRKDWLRPLFKKAADRNGGNGD